MTHQVHEKLHNFPIDAILAVVKENVAILRGAQGDTTKARVQILRQLTHSMSVSLIRLWSILFL